MSEIPDIVDYLQGREEAVATQIASMNDDLKKIHKLLRALGVAPRFEFNLVSSSPGAAVEPDADVAQPEDNAQPAGRSAGRYGRPVRAIVQELLESANRAWTSAEVQEAVRVEVGPERVDDKLQATVRTALWTLRQHGQSHRNDDGTHIATKWLEDTEAPAGTGASGTAPTSGPEGGENHHDPVPTDHRDHLQQRNGVRSGGTPVVRG